MNLIFNPILATWQILGRGQRLTKGKLAPNQSYAQETKTIMKGKRFEVSQTLNLCL